MSVLRARCPDCRTLTAVAIGPDYQCHSCGREFAAGIVRVGTERMELPWPEADQLPQRPIVLAAAPDAHHAAIEELTRRHGRLAVVWIGGEPPPLPPGAALVAPAGPFPDAVYVAVDAAAVDDGLEVTLASIPRPVGAGFTAFPPSERSEALLARLGAALGL